MMFNDRGNETIGSAGGAKSELNRFVFECSFVRRVGDDQVVREILLEPGSQQVSRGKNLNGSGLFTGIC